MSQRKIYGIGLVTSLCVFGVANLLHFLRPVTCYDCFFPYGLPFTFFREEGFAGGAGLLWKGVALDFVTMVSLGAIAGSLLRVFIKGRPK